MKIGIHTFFVQDGMGNLFSRIFRRSRQQAPEAPREHPVWLALCRKMDQEELWKDPGLTLSRLCLLLHSNKTTISTQYRIHGTSFLEDVNRRRIDYVKKRLQAKTDLTLEELFYEAGFRSYTTGWRQFRLRTGMFPTAFCVQK